MHLDVASSGGVDVGWLNTLSSPFPRVELKLHSSDLFDFPAALGTLNRTVENFLLRVGESLLSRC